MNHILSIYQNCTRLPFGKRIFSKILCIKAPYFGSIRPEFLELKPGFCKIKLKKRRSVTNHLGSVHAIAICNVSELAAGSAVEASIPESMRWIPKGMTVSYLKIAKTDLTAVCVIAPETLGSPGDVPVVVKVSDFNGATVFKAKINMYLTSEK